MKNTLDTFFKNSMRLDKLSKTCKHKKTETQHNIGMYKFRTTCTACGKLLDYEFKKETR